MHRLLISYHETDDKYIEELGKRSKNNVQVEVPQAALMRKHHTEKLR